MRTPKVESAALAGLDFVSRWRPCCLCWTSEPLFHG